MATNLTKVINKPLTVVHIASGDLWAGAEVQLYHLACALHNQAEIQLYIILFNHGELEEKLKKNNISVTVLDEQKISSLSILWKLITYFRQIRPEIVHTHRNKENVLASIAGLFCDSVGLRTVHGAAENKLRWTQFGKQVNRFFDWASGRFIQKKIILVSDELKQRFNNSFPDNRIMVIENGANIKEIIESSNNTISLPNPNAAVKIALVGRLTPVKRFDLAIKIAHRLAQQGRQDLQYYLFGSGPLEDELKNQIQALALNHNVHMMGFQTNIPAFIKQMDMLLITSDHEGLPMCLLEATALGIPVLSRAVGGIPKILEAFAPTSLIRENSETKIIDQFTNLILQHTQDPNLLKSQFEQGKHYIESQYSINKKALAFTTLYQQLTSTQ